MHDVLKEAVEKLRAIRERTDLKLKKLKYLKETFVNFAGEEKPLVLRYYQVQGVLHLVTMRRFLLGDDTGLGKTIQSIAALCCVWETDPNRKVIVLTTKSSIQQWVGEFANFTRGVRVLACVGDAASRKLAMKEYQKSQGPTVMVSGYKSLANDFTQVQDWDGYILITDEATAYKNTTTQIHQICRHLSSKADRVWALTATMIKNKLLEGYGIFQVLVPGLFGMNQNNFLLYYAIVRMQVINNGRQIPIVVGYAPSKITEFKNVIDPYFIGRAKHEVASELPSLTSKVVDVVMTEEQNSKYVDALDGMLEVVKGNEATAQEVTKLMAVTYCQEIVNDLRLIGHKTELSPKIEAVIDMVKHGEFAGEKVIVFSRFEKMVSYLMDRLKAEKVTAVRITGKESTDQRQSAMKAFQNPESGTDVICLTAAGSESINLQAAKALICIDTPWSAGEFIQLIGRMIRIGSVHDRCFVVHLVASRPGKKKETIDHRVMEVLSQKMELVTAVLGKRIKGESDTAVISSTNEISDIYQSLRQDGGAGKKTTTKPSTATKPSFVQPSFDATPPALDFSDSSIFDRKPKTSGLLDDIL